MGEHVPPARRLAPVDVLAAAGLVALAIVVVVLRHSGQLPFGSDHDEYRMVADALWSTGEPVVAGVEGTKYPVGYPWVLGLLDRVGLPITAAAQGLNALLGAGVVLAAWWSVRRPGTLRGVDRPARRLGGLVAGLGVVGAAWLWDAVWSVMPDVALTAVVAATVLAYLRTRRPTQVAVLTGLVVAGVLLKTIAIVVAGAVSVGLLVDRPGLRRWAWAPLAGAAAVTGLQALWMARYPAHTTGYLQTVFLEDPFDASSTSVGIDGLVARVPERLDAYLTSLANALTGPPDAGWVGIVVAVVLLAVAVGAPTGARGFLGVLVVAYAVALATWPYASPRFGLPMIPVTALGLGTLAAGVWRGAAGRDAPRPRPAARLIAGVLVVGIGLGHVVPATAQLRRLADEEARQLQALRPAMADAVDWMATHVGDDERIASLAYREIAYRLDRPVVPVPYTSEPETLRSVVGEAEWFVAVSDLYPQRDRVVRRLRDVLGDRLVHAHGSDRVDVYRVRPAP